MDISYLFLIMMILFCWVFIGFLMYHQRKCGILKELIMKYREQYFEYALKYSELKKEMEEIKNEL